MAYEYNAGTKIDAAIKKYAGDDQVKHQKLKETVRDYLGYSNFVGRMGKVSNAEPNINLRGNITPEGVKSLVGGGIDMQQTEINYLKQLGKGVNVAADQIATEKEKKDKETKAKFKLQEPKDWVESEFKNWRENPYNADGSVKTYEQWHKEVTDRITGEGDMPRGGTEKLDAMGKAIPGSGTPYQSSTDIDATVNAMMQGWDTWREDYAKDPRIQSYVSMGYTAAEAQDLVAYDKYAKGQMSDAVSDVYKVKNPTWAKNAELIKQEPQLLQDTTAVMVNGNLELPKTLAELKNDYPSLDEKTLTDMVKPSYQKLVGDDMRQWVQKIDAAVGEGGQNEDGTPVENFSQRIAIAKNAMNNPQVGEEIAADTPQTIMEDPNIKNFIYSTQRIYADVLTAAEIEQSIFDYLFMSK